MFRTRYRLLVALTPNSMEKIRKKTSRVSSVRRVALGMAAVLFVALPGTTARANVVSDWDAIAATTIVTNAHQPPAASAIWFAYMHLAVYDAVDSFDQSYQPYIFTTVPPAGASEDAAAIAAAHRILVNYFPAQQASLDTQFSSSIGAILDAPANIAAGEAVGEASAQALIVARTGDGLLAVVPYTPPVGTGFWEPTPPAFAPPQTPWLGQMIPFTMTSADQFFPGGPDPLTSKNWIADYDEVMALGSLGSTVRTAQQTEIGLFWTEHTGQQYARAFRGLATQEGLNTADTARMMAMLWTGEADALIGCFNAKYSFSFWRPVTAIEAGGGNPLLTADPTWTPLSATPPHPEYPSAHGCATSAVTSIVAALFGKHVSVTVTSLVTNTTHTFSRTDDWMNEVSNARIYAGFHYRHSVNDGRVLGRKVAKQLVKGFFRKSKPNHN